MSTGDEKELEGFTAKRKANTKILKQEHAWRTQKRGWNPYQNKRDGLGMGCTNHVGLFGQCSLIFDLNEVGSYCALLGRGVS